MTMTMALLILLAALQVGDAATTRRVIDQGGREINPVMRWAFAKLGFWPAIAIKSVFVVGLGSLLPLLPLVGLCAFYAGLVAWNWRQIRRR